MPFLNSGIKEKLYRLFFKAGDIYRGFRIWITGLCRFFFVIALLSSVVCFVYYLGFEYAAGTREGLISAFRILFLVIFISKFLPDLFSLRNRKTMSVILEALIFGFSTIVLAGIFFNVNHGKRFWELFGSETFLITGLFLIGLSEISVLAKVVNKIKIPPALIFAFSFMILIFAGSGLLMLPKAHTGYLNYLDALFTSVSAVCVTGLVVVDTATSYTLLGKIIIICLIQTGGLGIMTFTGFFGYIFASSGSSFRNKLLLKEIFSSESLNNLFKLITKIILFTFLTEIIGAALIYASLDFPFKGKAFFSLFHSVSAFCNAGFSTLPAGLNTPGINNNPALLITVAMLIILGGIGFPVLVGIYSSVKQMLVAFIKRIRNNRMPVKPGKRDIPTRIVIFTTVILIFAGTLFYYLFEPGTGMTGQRLLKSFFGSVSARTAGFNMTDITQWSYPTVMLMIVLMWIGASPGSTGGGIKTTTFTLALKSVINNLRGRDHLKINNREISHATITRVLSIIFLSLVIITTGFVIILVSEPGKNPLYLLFECVSAFSTVGLSLADTSLFSQTGKIVLIFLMFIGRVGPFTLISGILLSHKKRYYRYPELEILIN